MEPSVYFILINWNGSGDTLECLESISRLAYPNYSVVVVDNASTDNSPALIREWARQKAVAVSEYAYASHEEGVKEESIQPAGRGPLKRLLLVSSSYNTGFCEGNNIGMRLACAMQADYVFIVNNDTVLDSYVVRHLVSAAQSRREGGLFSPLICYADEPNKIWWGGGEFNKWLKPRYRLQGEHRNVLRDRGLTETGWASGCATFMSVETFTKYGGFDEGFFIWCDEWDLSLRIKQAGLKLFLVPQAILYHRVGKSLGITSPLVFFYSLRNMLVLRRRYLAPVKWRVFLVAYLPYKLLQAAFYSVKFKNMLFLYGFFDVMRGQPGKGGGMWKRQK
jgi:hypothetical protein